MVSNLLSWHENMAEMAIFNIYYVQQVLTPKVGWPELQFLCSAHPLRVLHICEKIHETISNEFQLIKWT